MNWVVKHSITKKDPENNFRVHTRFSGINKVKTTQSPETFLLPKVELKEIFVLAMDKKLHLR